MILSVDALPVSVNALYKKGKYGNTYKTEKADVFRDLLWMHVIEKGREKIVGFVEIKSAKFFFKDKKKFKASDVDNLLKHALDCVVYTGVIEDDRYVKKICEVEKFLSDSDRTEIVVESSGYILT